MSVLLAPPGPIDLFAKMRTTGLTWYIGTCREAPEVEVRPAFIDIKNDIGGRSVPVQKLYDGEQHLIYLTATNRLDWAGYKAMSRAIVGGGGGLLGADGPLDRGSLVMGSTDFEFVLKYNFGTTVVAPEMPVGRRYWSCVLLGARESTAGTRLMEVSMILEANAVYTSTGQSPNANRSFSLYSEQAADVLNGLPANY